MRLPGREMFAVVMLSVGLALFLRLAVLRPSIDSLVDDKLWDTLDATTEGLQWPDSISLPADPTILINGVLVPVSVVLGDDGSSLVARFLGR